ncbi:MAG: AarF/UbiB family protein [Flavobacteriaceae bacterium]|nr:AarF/UbiB family protein [Flavobacteriaceae bacterium]
MGIIPEKYEQYVKFFEFIVKYRKSDVFRSATDVSLDNDSEFSTDLNPAPEELAKDLKKMGPTYVKLGQLLSTRPDLLPEPYLEALAELQDDVENISFGVVEQIIQEELGVKMSKIFKDFDYIPIASASIGQVHRAELFSGKIVAVKVQRPGAREQITKDVKALQEMANFAVKHSEDARKYALDDVIEEISYTLLNELDYRQEAKNLLMLQENLKEFEHLVIPQPVMDFTTKKVLTMDFITGHKVTDITPFRKLEHDLSLPLEDLVKAYLKQIIVDGFAHADPHPGNIQLTRDNRVALIDLGMVAKFGKNLQESILKLMMAISQFDGDEVSKILLDISKYDAHHANTIEFSKQIGRMVRASENSDAQEMQTGKMMILMNRVAAQNDIKLPVELNILGKILLNMDRIVASMNPNYQIQETIRNYIHEIMQKKMWKELKPENAFSVLLESKKLTENLPERLNKITENLANNELQIKVDAIDEQRFTDAFQKVANRITVGLIIAAMIVGAALLIQVPTKTTIMGYPALAIIMFLIAALLGFYLIYAIIKNDESFRLRK